MHLTRCADSILEAVAKHLPELLPFATSTLSGPSDLQFANFTLQSEGAQQGDPLGLLYFCLVIIELLKAMKSEIVLAYVDNITLEDDAKTVLGDFLQLEESALRVSLEINRDKCEVVGILTPQWHYSPPTMSRYLISVRRRWCCRELLCQSVHIPTRYSKRGERSCGCRQ